MNYPVPPRRFALSRSLRRVPTAHARALAWAALLVVAACSGAQAKPSFKVQPPPAWVQPVAVPQATTDARAKDTESGVRFLLDDRHARVGDKGLQEYFHLVEQVTTAAAVEKVSQ